MIDASSFIEATRDRGFGLYSGVPCSYLTPFINRVIDDRELRYVGAANEGEAVAIAAGAELGGVRGVAIFQNSGLGNAVSPLTSLTHVFQIPILLISTLRGQPGGPSDEPQHSLMGGITTRLFELMDIPWEYFPDNVMDIGSSLDRAIRYMDEARRPYAFVMRKGTVEPWDLRTPPMPREISESHCRYQPAQGTRHDMLKAIQAQLDDGDIVIATTGYTGRELFALGDRPNQFYMVGSMGCASSFGLGLALAQPSRRVIVIDGDGAALMRLGALPTLGYERPPNLLHILLDNQVHESTGAQSTVSHSIDFCRIASACGYPVVERIPSPEALTRLVGQRRDSLVFVHVPIRTGVPEALGRPTIGPVDVAVRLRRFCVGDML